MKLKVLVEINASVFIHLVDKKMFFIEDSAYIPILLSLQAAIVRSMNQTYLPNHMYIKHTYQII